MEELYLYALNGHKLTDLIVCCPNNDEEYILKELYIGDLRSDTLYLPIQDFLDDLQNW